MYAGDLWGLIQHSRNKNRSKVKAGWEYLRTIVMEDSRSCNYSDLMELLGEQIVAGRLRLRRGVFNISYSNHTSIGFFFRILKSYAVPLSPNDFSISLIAADSLISNQMLELVSFKNLTDLTLYSSYYRPTRLGLGSTIFGLNSLLTNSTNLEKLSLPISRFHDPEEFNPWPMENLQSVLDLLRESFRRLVRLKELRIGGLFVHPELFVVPPVGVRVLEYKCFVTPGWWTEFSKCAFEGVERLVVECTDAGKWWKRDDYTRVGGIRWTGDGIDSGSSGSGSGTFELDRIAFTGLKEFKGSISACGPTNLLKLVLENNKGLSAASVKNIMTSEETFRKTMERIKNMAIIEAEAEDGEGEENLQLGSS
ncbi:hypothetical protein TWF730_009318 [Orbilia blumenaviensis]